MENLEEKTNGPKCPKCYIDCSTGENNVSYNRIGVCSSCHEIFKPSSPHNTWDNSSWRTANS